MSLRLDHMLMIRGSERSSLFERRSESMTVLRLTVDTGSRSIDVVEMTFDLSVRVVDCGEIVVRLEELLILNDGGGVTVDRGVFVRAYVPDGCCCAIGCGGGGEWGRGESDRDIAVKGCHCFLDASDHLVDSGSEEGDSRGGDCCCRERCHRGEGDCHVRVRHCRNGVGVRGTG